jgi:hypothetical protein
MAIRRAFWWCVFSAQQLSFAKQFSHIPQRAAVSGESACTFQTPAYNFERPAATAI